MERDNLPIADIRGHGNSSAGTSPIDVGWEAYWTDERKQSSWEAEGSSHGAPRSGTTLIITTHSQIGLYHI